MKFRNLETAAPVKAKIAAGVLVFLSLANFLAWGAIFDLSGQNLKLIFFDVGQGDAAFIETPPNYQILIDGGPSSIILDKLGKVMPFWDRSIDLIILSHPEADHLAGLLEVLKRYRVKNIWWSGVVRQTAEYREWVRLIKKEKADVKIVEADQMLSLSERLSILVLYPFENFQDREFKNSNMTSLILRLDFGENSFLFTGDMPSSGEKEMILREADLDSDVLKVGHHGSKTSSSDEFLEKVSPELAVISVGKDNTYRHPHPEVLERFERYGIKVIRTDSEGDIKIFSDGKNYGISNF